MRGEGGGLTALWLSSLGVNSRVRWNHCAYTLIGTSIRCRSNRVRREASKADPTGSAGTQHATPNPDPLSSVFDGSYPHRKPPRSLSAHFST